MAHFYVSKAQLLELKKVLAQGGRWHTRIPDHEAGLSSRFIDFCPGFAVEGEYFKIELKYLNCFPARENLRRGAKIRIQFNNEQRRRILLGKYKLQEE